MSRFLVFFPAVSAAESVFVSRCSTFLKQELLRHLSTTPAVSSNILPTSSKFRQGAGKKLLLRTEEELRRRLKRLRRGNQEKRPVLQMLEDPEKVSIISQRLREAVRAALEHPNMADTFANKGITVTEARIKSPNRASGSYTCVKWISSASSEDELSLEKELDNRSAELTLLAERCWTEGKVPQLVFKKDLQYLSSVLLTREFDKIALEDGSYIDQFSKVETHPDSCGPIKLQEVCRMLKKTDVLGIDRQFLMEKTAKKLAKAKATHRVSQKPGLDEPPQTYQGFGDETMREETTGERSSVKRYLDERKKAANKKEAVSIDPK